MDIFVQAATWFYGLFKTGGEVFLSWTAVSTSLVPGTGPGTGKDALYYVSGLGFLPTVLMLLIAMNSIIMLIGQDRINGFARKAGGNPVSRYMLLPFLGAFMLCNPMVLSLGRFLPEKYKPSYYASAAQFCHTSNGVFPHINAGEYFIWMGIASGIIALHLDPMQLAFRYMLVGLVMNFVGGWVTDFITPWVAKQQGVTLSSEVKMEVAA
jgi:PTS system glucitol/sorbitol-specific IIC component